MSKTLLLDSYATERVEIGDKIVVRLADPALRGLSSAELAVHRCLLWRRNDETGQCNPAHSTLAAETGLSAATAKRAVLGLRDKGLWTWTGGKANSPGRGRTANSYVLGPKLTKRSSGPNGHVDQEVNPARPVGHSDPDQLVTLTKEQPKGNNSKGKSPRGQDDLTLRVCSILQGGVDSLDDNDFGRPWPSAKAEVVAELIEGQEGVDEGTVIAAATAAREIVQSQDRAPNVSGLFAAELEKAVAARRTGVRRAIAQSPLGKRDHCRYDAVVEPAA